jgi:hypothetical protein
MALLHRADMRPSKLELLTGWLPTRPWYPGPTAAGLRRVVSFRFDDPDGEVGIETLLVRAGEGPLIQAPLTYRGAPLPGADDWLLGTSEHSVLGTRWIYDGCGDPLYASTLASAILAGTGQAEEFLEVDGRPERREPSMSVHGSGSGTELPAVTEVSLVDEADPTVIRTNAVELTVRRVLDGDGSPDRSAATLTGTWSGRPTPVLLAEAR